MSSNVGEILEATHCDDKSRPPGMVSCDYAQVLHTPAILKNKSSSSSTTYMVLPRKLIKNIPKKNDQNSKTSSVNKQNINNKGQLMSWMKRKLSHEKESDTTTIVKLSRSEGERK